jgi:ABC-2 type transport system ATP-binding protein
MCSRVLVLEKGKLVFDGPTEEGIAFMKYDDDDEDENPELDSDSEMDEELGADI